MKLAGLGVDVDGHQAAGDIAEVNLLSVPAPDQAGNAHGDAVDGDLPAADAAGKRDHVHFSATAFVRDVGQPVAVGREAGKDFVELRIEYGRHRLGLV